MIKNISKTFLLIFFAVFICCVMYPALLWAVGKVFFPFQAEGSVLYGPDGKPIGSELIAQPFTHDEYFQPRPSAASYNGAASASAALAPSNPQLRSRAAAMIDSIVKHAGGPLAGHNEVPGDMITTSASGLDPHITLENAQFQLDRVAAKWAVMTHRDPLQVRAEIQRVLDANEFAPLKGLVGEKMVNVLIVNLELKKRFKAVL